jgi:hypothetical protein
MLKVTAAIRRTNAPLLSHFRGVAGMYQNRIYLIV